jgi:DNA-binding MarR family transcriptional regulator
MPSNSNDLLSGCLYFTANSLARTITRMADEEFGRIGLVPSHAFLLMQALEEPGISQKDLAERLHLAQSTVSRFVDALVLRGFLEKRSQGKVTNIYPTDKVTEQLEEIHKAWKSLYRRYSAVLGEEEGRELTRLADRAHQKLEAGP